MEKSLNLDEKTDCDESDDVNIESHRTSELAYATDAIGSIKTAFEINFENNPGSKDTLDTSTEPDNGKPNIRSKSQFDVKKTRHTKIKNAEALKRKRLKEAERLKNPEVLRRKREKDRERLRNPEIRARKRIMDAERRKMKSAQRKTEINLKMLHDPTIRERKQLKNAERLKNPEVLLRKRINDALYLKNPEIRMRKRLNDSLRLKQQKAALQRSNLNAHENITSNNTSTDGNISLNSCESRQESLSNNAYYRKLCRKANLRKNADYREMENSLRRLKRRSGGYRNMENSLKKLKRFDEDYRLIESAKQALKRRDPDYAEAEREKRRKRMHEKFAKKKQSSIPKVVQTTQIGICTEMLDDILENELA